MDILINALNDCLEKIQSGAQIDQVIESYPEIKEELRSLLETAVAAKSLRFEQTIPITAVSHSRSKYLSQAEKMVNARRHPRLGTAFRSSAALVYGIILFLVVGLGTGIASAQSIPGDIFYPVKIASEQTRLFLENNPVTRITLEENYDRQRAQETDSLMQRERQIETTFAGFLTRQERDQWAVAGIRVNFPQNLQNQAQEMRGKYIEVTGLPQSSGIFMVEDVHLRQFDITGTIDAIQSDHWTVSQMSLGVSTDTLINGQPKIGGDAKFTVIRTVDDQLQAISIQALIPNEPNERTATQPPAGANHPTVITATLEKTSPDDNSDSIQKTPVPSTNEKSPALSPTKTQQPTRQYKEDDQQPIRTQVKSGPQSVNATPSADINSGSQRLEQEHKSTQHEKDPGVTPDPGSTNH